MRSVIRSLAVVGAIASFVPFSTSSVSAADPSASPSVSVEPSESPRPDAVINLAPLTEMIEFRTWAISVTGGSPSVDTLQVQGFGSGFEVTVDGESATVELALALPAELVLRASCSDAGGEIGHVEPPRRFVFDVAPGGFYDCDYDTQCAGPSSPPYAGVAVSVSATDFDVSRRWPISVAGGRTLGSDELCGTSPISALTLVRDPDIPDALFGAFSVEVFEQSASVDITAPRPRGGSALVAAECGEQDEDGRLHDVLVPPRRLVFDVVPMGLYDCFVQGRRGTVPPTDTHAASALAASSAGMTGLVFGLLVAVFSGAFLMGRRRAPDRPQVLRRCNR